MWGNAEYVQTSDAALLFDDVFCGFPKDDTCDTPAQMIVRAARLFLFSCAAFAFTSCQNMANPLDGATRMLQAMGRSARILSDSSKTDAIRLDAGDIERAREAELQNGALPENAPTSPGGSGEHQFASAR